MAAENCVRSETWEKRKVQMPSGGGGLPLLTEVFGEAPKKTPSIFTLASLRRKRRWET